MSARDLVQTFLRRMEERDLAAAEAMMADNAVIIFPGNRRFSSQHEMVAGAKGRYQWVKKTFDQMDAFSPDDGTEVVYIMGTLYGVNNSGVAFEGVRYIDRFVLRDGKIVEQHVWNDLAEMGVLQKTIGSESS